MREPRSYTCVAKWINLRQGFFEVKAEKERFRGVLVFGNPNGAPGLFLSGLFLLGSVFSWG